MHTQQPALSSHIILRDAIPTVNHVREILSSLGANAKESYMRTLVSLVATTGIRQRELCDARWSDVEFSKRWICVHSKGQERKVPFGPKVLDLLQSQHDQNPGSHYVLGCNPSGVVNHLRKMSLRYKDLRHFFLAQWFGLGGDPGSFMTVAGYSSSSTGIRFIGSPEQALKIGALHQEKVENELFKSSDTELREVSE
jgi:integrase